MVAWLGDNPLDFAFTTPEQALAALGGAGFAEAGVISNSGSVEEIFVEEVRRLNSIPPDELIRLLGQEQASGRKEGAAHRLAAVRAGHLRPCLLRGRRVA